jgi:hypothetical protein
MTPERRSAMLDPMMAVARPALPQRAPLGGAAWRAKYRALSPGEQADILVKMIAGHLTAVAKRKGYPPPVVMRDYQYRTLPNGALVYDPDYVRRPVKAEEPE